MILLSLKCDLKLIWLIILCYYINKSEEESKFINNKSTESSRTSSSDEKNLNSDDKSYDDNVSEDSLTVEENNTNKTSPRIININTLDFKTEILHVIEEVVKNNLPNLNKTLFNITSTTENTAKKQNKGSNKVNRVNVRKTTSNKTNIALFSKDDSWNLNNKTIQMQEKLNNETKVIINEYKIDNATTIFPFAACVLKKGSYLTHGALLTDQWVITAAFDLFNVRESIKIYTIRLGSMNCKKGDKYPLKSIQIHPFYLKGLPDFDLAMLKIAYPVILTKNIRPIPISNENVRPIFAVTYSRKEPFEEDKLNWNTKEMNLCDLEKYTWDKCRKWLKRSRIVLNETSRCIRPESRCQGWKPHLSAPLISREGLVGIISGFQPKPSMEKDPLIFTTLSTSSVSNWIEDLLLRR